MLRLTIALIAAVLLTACATPMTPEAPRSIGQSREANKNYVIGQPKTVNVGDAMIKYQDYWVENIEKPIAIADRTFSIRGGLVDITVQAGREYPVRGQMNFEGQQYTVVALTDNPTQYQALLVRPDGSVLNRVAGAHPNFAGLVMVAYSLNISDNDARVVRERVRQVKTDRGYHNFELIYTGTTSNAINLTYREFSPEGLARVAFFQNLTYEAQAKVLTFKNFRIAVDKVNSESITFTVLSDGS